jgi:hypothetical protein
MMAVSHFASLANNAVMQNIHNQFNMLLLATTNVYAKKYNIQDENSDVKTFALQDYYNLKLKDKTIFLKVTNNMEAEPSPAPISISEPIATEKSNNVNDSYSPPIEVTVIFNNVGIELEEYLKENNYLR